jgi:hypothetical protein
MLATVAIGYGRTTTGDAAPSDPRLVKQTYIVRHPQSRLELMQGEVLAGCPHPHSLKRYGHNENESKVS